MSKSCRSSGSRGRTFLRKKSPPYAAHHWATKATKKRINGLSIILLNPLTTGGVFLKITLSRPRLSLIFFGFDAAILFSDILVVPHALGQRVTFVEGEGPRLDALKDPVALQTLRVAIDHTPLERVYETIARVRQDLPPAVTFLGFCGAPWTLATYMIASDPPTRSVTPSWCAARWCRNCCGDLLYRLGSATRTCSLRQALINDTVPSTM
jgi:hypothetical protein